MKLVFIALSICIASLSFAQSNGKFEFKWTSFEDGETEVQTVKVYSRTDRVVLYTDESYGTETAVIDRTSKTLLELFVDKDEDVTLEEKYYALSTWEEDLEETAYVSEILSSAIESSIYGTQIKLLPEKKTIVGLPCQKFTFEEEGMKVTGWIALGIHVNVANQYKYFDTKEGMIVEFELTNEGNKYTVTLTGYDPKFSTADPVFSMIPPAGYEDLDAEIDAPEEEGE